MRGRGLLVAAIVAGLSYFFILQIDFSDHQHIVWKGAGVTLLALYAAANAKDLNGWLITAVMAFGAIGDILLDAVALEVGAVSFVIGHVFAIFLYLRNRRIDLMFNHKLVGIIIVPLSVVIAALLVPRSEQAGVAVYALFVAVMAATAWTSRFPRNWTGIGAMIFVVSDLLIFARIGPLATQNWVNYAIWALYFSAQLMIVIGVIKTLNEELPHEIAR